MLFFGIADNSVNSSSTTTWALCLPHKMAHAHSFKRALFARVKCLTRSTFLCCRSWFAQLIGDTRTFGGTKSLYATKPVNTIDKRLCNTMFTAAYMNEINCLRLQRHYKKLTPCARDLNTLSIDFKAGTHIQTAFGANWLLSKEAHAPPAALQRIQRVAQHPTPAVGRRYWFASAFRIIRP